MASRRTPDTMMILDSRPYDDLGFLIGTALDTKSAPLRSQRARIAICARSTCFRTSGRGSCGI
jgi:hypothetical protein